LLSCNLKKTPTYGPVEFAKDFNKSQLPAWEDKDTTIIIKWINSLEDTTISDYQFYNTVTGLVNKTNFAYGVEEPGSKEYWQTSLKTRILNRQNTADVYQLYKHSKVFMKRIDYYKSITLQDKYWNNTSKLSEIQIKKIKMAIDSLAF